MIWKLLIISYQLYFLRISKDWNKWMNEWMNEWNLYLFSENEINIITKLKSKSRNKRIESKLKLIKNILDQLKNYFTILQTLHLQLGKNQFFICPLNLVLNVNDFIFGGSLFHILYILEQSNFYRRKLQYYDVWLWYHMVVFLRLFLAWKYSSYMKSWLCFLFYKFQLLKFVIS